MKNLKSATDLRESIPTPGWGEGEGDISKRARKLG